MTKPAWRCPVLAAEEFALLEPGTEAYMNAVQQLTELAAALIYSANKPVFVTNNPAEEKEGYKEDIRSFCCAGFISLLEKPARKKSTALNRILDHAESEWNAAYRLGSRRSEGVPIVDTGLESVLNRDPSASPANRPASRLLDKLTEEQAAAFRCTSNSTGERRREYYKDLTGKEDVKEQYIEAKKALK